MNEPISPDERGGHIAPKAEGDSDPALSRFGAGKRQHMQRMLQHALDWITVNVAKPKQDKVLRSFSEAE